MWTRKKIKIRRMTNNISGIESAKESFSKLNLYFPLTGPYDDKPNNKNVQSKYYDINFSD